MFYFEISNTNRLIFLWWFHRNFISDFNRDHSPRSVAFLFRFFNLYLRILGWHVFVCSLWSYICLQLVKLYLFAVGEVICVGARVRRSRLCISKSRVVLYARHGHVEYVWSHHVVHVAYLCCSGDLWVFHALGRCAHRWEGLRFHQRHPSRPLSTQSPPPFLHQRRPGLPTSFFLSMLLPLISSISLHPVAVQNIIFNKCTFYI